MPIICSKPASSTRTHCVPQALGLRLLLACLALCLPAVPLPAAAAPGADLESKVKAAYIFHTLSFVEWPAPPPETSGAPLKVCLTGTDPVGTLLEELAGRTIKGRSLQIIRCQRNGAPPDCDLLFIARSEEAHLSRILQQYQGSAVLTVSDIERFPQRGGILGFVRDGGRIRLEVNPTAARASGLRLSARLLETARLVP